MLLYQNAHSYVHKFCLKLCCSVFAPLEREESQQIANPVALIVESSQME